MRRRHLISIVLLIALFSGVEATATDGFWVELGDDTCLVGRIEWDSPVGPRVSRAWLVEGFRQSELPVIDFEDLETDPLAIMLTGSWAAFEMTYLTPDVLVMHGVSAPLVGQDREPFGAFTAVMVPGELTDWYGKTVIHIDELMQLIDEESSMQDMIQPGAPLAGSCSEPAPITGDIRFVIRLSDNAVLIIIIHADGTIETYIYAKDLDGCWAVGDLPGYVWWTMVAPPLEIPSFP